MTKDIVLVQSAGGKEGNWSHSQSMQNQTNDLKDQILLSLLP
ncbi:hypothetical protein ACHAXN_008607 [Cyclotella atomus]